MQVSIKLNEHEFCTEMRHYVPWDFIYLSLQSMKGLPLIKKEKYFHLITEGTWGPIIFFKFGLIHMLFFSSAFPLPVCFINAKETVSVKELAKLKDSSLLDILGFKIKFQCVPHYCIFLILCISKSGTENLLCRNAQYAQLYLKSIASCASGTGVVWLVVFRKARM